jgi:hypothetical protein
MIRRANSMRRTFWAEASFSKKFLGYLLAS